MNFNQRLISGFGSVLIACLLLAGIAIYSMHKTRSEYQHLVVDVAQLKDLAKESELQLQAARANEQAYIASRQDEDLAMLRKNLSKLAEINTTVQKLAAQAGRKEVIGVMRKIEPQLESYYRQIDRLESLINEQGDKDRGIRGHIRERAHVFEAIANSAGSETLLAEYLMMRRHEKDFLLREDPKYQGKMKDQLETLIAKTRSDPLLSEEKRKEAIELAETYQAGFAELSENILKVVQLRPATVEASENIYEETQAIVKSVTEWQEELQSSIANLSRFLNTTLTAGSAILVAMVLVIGWWTRRSLNKIMQLNIASISQGTEQIQSASQQVSDSSQHLAQETSHQAASLETSSAALHDIARLTDENTDRTQKASELMENSGQSVGKARDSMGQLLEAFRDISDTSEEISKIVKTIDEIAFQTNILALNAAVEAARAGEAGAGFAVVADEVRALAGRAAEAAQNTTRLIETTIEKISRGDALAGVTNSAFQEVDTSNEQLGGLINEIASTASEHQSAIASIKNSIEQVEGGVQNNAAQSEETASAAQELNAQVNVMNESLRQLSHFFSVAQNINGYASRPYRMQNSTPNSTAALRDHSSPNTRQSSAKSDTTNDPGQLVSHGSGNNDDFTFFE